MAKTQGKHFPGKFSFKEETLTFKFAAFVNGEYKETTATSRGQADQALRARYRNENPNCAYVKIEHAAVRIPKPQTGPPPARPIIREVAETTEQTVSIDYLFGLLDQS